MAGGTTKAVDEQLWELLRAPLASWAIVTLVELGVPDELARNGPKSVTELARTLSADADVLTRILRTLATEGIFVEAEPGVFANTALSKALCEDGSWHDAFVVYAPVYSTLRELPRRARTSEPMFPRAAGVEWWTYLERNPALGATFNRLMQSGAANRIELLAALEWRDGSTVIDVGGGNGTLLLGLLERIPTVSGVVFELPDVARAAEERIAASGLEERCSVVRGSFFDSVPAGGDDYILAKVLHDWEDEPARQILQNVRAAALPTSRLLIVDAVVSTGANDPDDAKWTDLVMMTLVNGRERSVDEWRALLTASSFTPTRFDEQLIEAMPTGSR